MSRIEQPTLVKYDTLARTMGARRRRVRPRTVIYAGLLTAIAAAGTILVTTRKPFEATVGRAPGTLFQLDPDGSVRNIYFLNVTNNDPSPRPVTFTVRVEGLPDAQVLAEPVTLASTEMRRVPLVIRVPHARQHHLGRTVPIRVHVATGREERVLETTFKTGESLDAAAF